VSQKVGEPPFYPYIYIYLWYLPIEKLYDVLSLDNMYLQCKYLPRIIIKLHNLY